MLMIRRCTFYPVACLALPVLLLGQGLLSTASWAGGGMNQTRPLLASIDEVGGVKLHSGAQWKDLQHRGEEGWEEGEEEEKRKRDKEKTSDAHSGVGLLRKEKYSRQDLQPPVAFFADSHARIDALRNATDHPLLLDFVSDAKTRSRDNSREEEASANTVMKTQSQLFWMRLILGLTCWALAAAFLVLSRVPDATARELHGAQIVTATGATIWVWHVGLHSVVVAGQSTLRADDFGYLPLSVEARRAMLLPAASLAVLVGFVAGIIAAFWWACSTWRKHAASAVLLGSGPWLALVCSYEPSLLVHIAIWLALWGRESQAEGKKFRAHNLLADLMAALHIVAGMNKANRNFIRVNARKPYDRLLSPLAPLLLTLPDSLQALPSLLAMLIPLWEILGSILVWKGTGGMKALASMGFVAYHASALGILSWNGMDAEVWPWNVAFLAVFGYIASASSNVDPPNHDSSSDAGEFYHGTCEWKWSQLWASFHGKVIGTYIMVLLVDALLMGGCLGQIYSENSPMVGMLVRLQCRGTERLAPDSTAAVAALACPSAQDFFDPLLLSVEGCVNFNEWALTHEPFYLTKLLPVALARHVITMSGLSAATSPALVSLNNVRILLARVTAPGVFSGTRALHSIYHCDIIFGCDEHWYCQDRRNAFQGCLLTIREIDDDDSDIFRVKNPEDCSCTRHSEALPLSALPEAKALTCLQEL